MCVAGWGVALAITFCRFEKRPYRSFFFFNSVSFPNISRLEENNTKETKQVDRNNNTMNRMS